MARVHGPMSFQYESCSRCIQCLPHLSNVDQTTHEVLIAESRNGVLSLVPCSIFHNSEGKEISSWTDRKES